MGFLVQGFEKIRVLTTFEKIDSQAFMKLGSQLSALRHIWGQILPPDSTSPETDKMVPEPEEFISEPT